MLVLSKYQLEQIDRNRVLACCRQLHEIYPEVALKDIERTGLDALTYGCDALEDVEIFIRLHLDHQQLMHSKPDWYHNLFISCAGSFNNKLKVAKNNLNTDYGK